MHREQQFNLFAYVSLAIKSQVLQMVWTAVLFAYNIIYSCPCTWSSPIHNFCCYHFHVLVIVWFIVKVSAQCFTERCHFNRT